jgi:hypothetical protein
MSVIYDPWMTETVHMTERERRAAAEVRLRTGELAFQPMDASPVPRRRSRVGNLVAVALHGLLALFGG